jgi:hypothetical protein
MSINLERYQQLSEIVRQKNAVLVAVSKTKPIEDILALYELGHRDFGENYVQELVEKQQQLPKDIRWHFIGHLQTNKVKYLAPFVHLIHGVDSLKLANEINKQGKRVGRVLDILFQVHIAVEETKFGFDESELKEAIQLLEKDSLTSTRIRGLMGMASFTNDQKLILNEFRTLKNLFDQFKHSTASQIAFDTLSMGMSSDYQQALEEGSTMIRVGSLIFGERNYI